MPAPESMPSAPADLPPIPTGTRDLRPATPSDPHPDVCIPWEEHPWEIPGSVQDEMAPASTSSSFRMQNKTHPGDQGFSHMERIEQHLAEQTVLMQDHRNLMEEQHASMVGRLEELFKSFEQKSQAGPRMPAMPRKLSLSKTPSDRSKLTVFQKPGQVAMGKTVSTPSSFGSKNNGGTNNSKAMQWLQETSCSNSAPTTFGATNAPSELHVEEQFAKPPADRPSIQSKDAINKGKEKEDMQRQSAISQKSIASDVSGSPSFGAAGSQKSGGFRISKKLFRTRAISRISTVLKPGQSASLQPFGSGQVHSIVANSWFDHVIAICIVLNVIFIGLDTDWSAKNGRVVQRPLFFRIAEVCFCIIFAIELALRIHADRCPGFYKGKNWRWNLLDSIIVLSAILEEILQLVWDSENNEEDVASNTSVVRVIRVLRIMRILRGARLARFFKDLRVMVSCISSSIKSLVWCILLMTIVMFLFAIMLLEIITPELNARRAQGMSDDLLLQHFNGVLECIYSLFKAITSGEDWGNLADPLGDVHNWLAFLFCIYIAFAVFCVLNIVTGIFVENATKLAQGDLEMMIIEEMAARGKVIEEVKAIFNKADTDDSGMLDWQKFLSLMEDPMVVAYFKKLELHLDHDGAHGLFQLLDFEQTGFIDIDTFVIGCTQLRGQAKSLDIARLRHDNKRLHKMIDELGLFLEALLGGTDMDDDIVIQRDSYMNPSFRNTLIRELEDGEIRRAPPLRPTQGDHRALVTQSSVQSLDGPRNHNSDGTGSGRVRTSKVSFAQDDDEDDDDDDDEEEERRPRMPRNGTNESARSHGNASPQSRKRPPKTIPDAKEPDADEVRSLDDEYT